MDTSAQDHPALAELARSTLDSRVSEYRSVYSALASIVDPPGATSLLRSVYPAATLYRTVPWLAEELIAVFPEIGRLPDLARATIHQDPGTIPLHGFSSHRVLQALRFGENDTPEDKPLRALVLTLASRRACWSGSDPLHDRIQLCLDALGPAINGLYHQRTKPNGEKVLSSPLLPLLAQCAHHISLQEYVYHLRALLLADQKVHRDLVARVRRDIPELLNISIPTTEKGKKKKQKKPKKKKVGAIPPLPPDEPNPDPEKLRILVPVDPTDPQQPEPPDEYTPYISVSISEPTTGKPPTLQEILQEARKLKYPQRISHANELLLDFHVDVLTPAETKLLAPAITSHGINAAKNGDLELAVQFAIAGLMLSLGYELNRAAGVLTASAYQTERPYLSPDCTYLISPALIPDNAFQSDSNGDESSLRPTAETIRIPLPPPLAELLQALDIGPARRAQIRQLRKGVSRAIAAACDELGLMSVTMGRVRRTCSARLYEHSKDLAAVMQVTRDTFGQSLAPLYYCSFSESHLQQIYRGAIWNLWGLETDQATGDISNTRVGSQALLYEKQAKHVSHSIGAMLQAPTPAQPTCNDIAREHNVLMKHLSGMLISVVGHRPVNALFSLTLNDFDLSLHAAVFRDKRIDLAHLERLVALGSKVSEQIRAYLSHLIRLIDYETLPQDSHKWILGVLNSEHPLLFHLSGAGATSEMSIDRWRADLPLAWQDIPTNWGRHFLASVGRDLGISPELLHIQLGHYESVGYPFSPDSPLNPLSFLEEMNPVLDNLFRLQGWSCRKLRKGKSSWHDSWESVGPLHDWTKQLQEHAQLIREQRAKLRRHYLATQRSVRQRAEDLVLEHVAQTDARLADLVSYRIRELRYRRSEVPATSNTDTDSNQGLYRKAPEKISIPTEKIMSLQERLDLETTNNPALHIATHNVLARCLRWAARKELYVGLLPGFWICRAPADPTPFMRSHMQAIRQIRLLRESCTEAFQSPRFRSDEEFRLGTIILCLIIHGGIDDLGSILYLLDPETLALSAPAISDCLIASSPSAEKAIGLRHKAALAYALWRRDFQNNVPPDEQQLEHALEQVLPEQAIPPSKLLGSLLATMKAANRIERSGLHNLALDPDKGCVSLLHDRLLELLGNAAEIPDPLKKISVDPKTERPTRNQVQKEYRAINRIWPNKHRDISLPETGEVVELTQRFKPSRKRRIYKELLEMARNPSRSELGRRLAGWLAWELIDRRPNADNYRKYGAVYPGFTEVCKRLVKRYEPGIEDLDAEETENLYVEILESAATTNISRINRALQGWHRYLIRYHGVEPIDLSRMNQMAGQAEENEYIVDNQMMLPSEAQAISDVISENDVISDSPQTGAHCDYRIVRQTKLLFSILNCTGARFKEALNLRARDVIIVDDHIYLIMRNTGYLPVKTRYSRRLVNFSARATESECVQIRDWIKSEFAIGRLRKPGDYLLTDLTGKPVDPDLFNRILKSIYQSISVANLKNHHVRHTVISDETSIDTMSVSIQELSNPHSVASFNEELALPRDFQYSTRQRGHKLARTSIRSYVHIPWAFSLHTQSRKEHIVDRHTLAAALNVSASAADNRIQRHGPEKANARAMRSIASINEVESTHQIRVPNLKLQPELRYARKALYLHARGTGIAKDKAALAFGLQVAEIQALHAAARLLVEKTSICLIPEQELGAKEASKPPRWYGGSQSLQSLWKHVELGTTDSEHIIWVAEQWYAYSLRSDRSNIRLPSDALPILRMIIGTDHEVKAESTKGSLLMKCFVTTPAGRSENHALAWVLAIAWTIHRSRTII